VAEVAITLKNKNGVTIHSGAIVAQGGLGGAGGTLDISGLKVSFTGTVDLTALGGTTGTLTIDPATFTVAPSGGDETGAALSAALNTANVNLNADTGVFVDDNVTWTSGNTLTLSTNLAQSSIVITGAISGVNGTLTINGANQSVVVGDVNALAVSNFLLACGTWSQSGTLPTFVVGHDFEIQGSSTFIRVAGGDGSANSPLEITDVYGLQGLASPSGELLNSDVQLVNNISALGTSTWNSNTGFVPIGTSSFRYNGTFDGQGHTINGLVINLPSTNGVGLFAFTSATTTVENVGLTNAQITGSVNVGALVGNNVGAIVNTFSTGSVSGGSGTDALGGLVGANNGTIDSSSSTASVTASSGVNYGGLAGFNTGTISNTFSTGAVSVTSGNGEGGLVGYNDGGTINNSYSTGAVTGSVNVGAFVGYNGGTINNSFWDTTTSGITSPAGGVGNRINSGVTGATTSQLESQVFILGNSPVSPTWDFTNIWTTNGGTTTPQLIGQPTGTPTSPATGTLGGIAYTDSGMTISAGTTIDLIFDGGLLDSTTTDNGGNYSFNITVSDLTGGLLVTDATDHGNTLYQLNTPSGTSFTSVDIWGNTLIINSNSQSNAGLKTAAGSLSGLGINYTVNGAALATNPGINIIIQHGYQLDGNITAGGSFVTESGANLTGSQDVALSGTSVRMAGTFNTTGSITITSTAGPIFLNEIGTDAGTAFAKSLTLNSAGSVSVYDSSIQLSDGNFSASGSGDSFTLDGVDILNSEIDTEGGSYTINGAAGSNQNGATGDGVFIDNSSLVTTNGTSIVGGHMTITGTSALSSSFTTNGDLDGVYITHSVLGLVNGALSVTGTVSSGVTNGAAAGILVDNASVVQATGTGSLSLAGNSSGSTSSSGNYGVHITGGSILGAANASGTSVSGINITGRAGDMTNEATVATDAGIDVDGGGLLIASGTAPITLVGFGGADTNTDVNSNTGSGGVFLTSQTDGETSSISSSSGAISITGTSGASPLFSFGVNVFGYNGGIAAISSNSGHITITGSTTTAANSSNELDGVVFQSAAQISNVTGDISIIGNVLNGTADFDSLSTAQGVNIFGGSILTSGSGSVSITGDTTGTTSTYRIVGVLLQDEAISSSSGNITLGGTSSNPGSVADELGGIQINDGSSLSTGNGAISLTGTVSAGTSEGNALGIDISGGSTVTAHGTLGNITLTGNTVGSTARAVNVGVGVGESGSTVSASGTAGLVIVGHAGGLNGAFGSIIDNTDLAVLEPASIGIVVVDGGSLVTTGSAPMTLTGTGGTNATTSYSDNGYIDPSTGSTPGSYGVAVFSPLTTETTSISSGGNLVVTGTAGASPISGIGVVAGGPSNRGNVSIISNGSVSLTGTGGAGNTTGSTSPNAGVAIFDPGNNNGSVSIHANGGNLVVTGTGGAGTDIVGINGAPFFDDVYSSPSFDPGLYSSATIRFVSLAGKIDMSGLAGGTNALATSVTTPVGTSSYTVFGSNSGTVTLNGGDFTASEFGGGVNFGPINVTYLTVTQSVIQGETPGTTNFSSITTGDLSITTVGSINLNGAIHAAGPVTIQNTGGNITLGAGGSITDSGAGNNVILAAGTDLATSHYIINNSSAGANAIQVSNGSHFYLYSADPASDHFGGISVAQMDVIYNALFSTTGLPAENQQLFYALSSGVGPTGPGGGSGANPPSTQGGGADGAGSNIVPPALTPGQGTITPVSGSTPITGVFQPAPISYSGDGASGGSSGSQSGNLASSSGNGGLVGSGDAAQLGGGQLNNISNPAASGVLNQALGPIVYHSLADALNMVGDMTDYESSSPGDSSTAASGHGDSDETILGADDVAVIGSNGVQNIDPSKAPSKLRKAMSSDVRKAMNGGAGH
jgi:hypothetical protein